MSTDPVQHHRYLDGLSVPQRVKVVEVGPRDGLQNFSERVPLQLKVDIIDHLSDCGFSTIEVGSLVSTRAVPQMADSDEVFRRIVKKPGTDYIMLVANIKGLQRALECSVEHIAVFCAASDAFSQNNVHATVDESLSQIQVICRQAISLGLSVRGYVSCVLGCPYQGTVALTEVVRVAGILYEFGCSEVSLGDTIGSGTPGMVKELIGAVSERVPVVNLAVHFHDTYGQALANIIVALQSGIHVIDSSFGGLGGCPFAPGASGNVASEDVLFMLNGLGIDSGINLAALLDANRFFCGAMGCQLPARVGQAMQPVDSGS